MLELSKIYLMQDTITTIVKLGISNNPQSRVDQINRTSKLAFRVLAESKYISTRGAYSLEKELLTFYVKYKFNSPYDFPGSTELLDLPEPKVKGLVDLVKVLDELI